MVWGGKASNFPSLADGLDWAGETRHQHHERHGHDTTQRHTIDKLRWQPNLARDLLHVHYYYPSRSTSRFRPNANIKHPDQAYLILPRETDETSIGIPKLLTAACPPLITEYWHWFMAGGWAVGLESGIWLHIGASGDGEQALIYKYLRSSSMNSQVVTSIVVDVSFLELLMFLDHSGSVGFRLGSCCRYYCPSPT